MTHRLLYNDDKPLPEVKEPMIYTALAFLLGMAIMAMFAACLLFETHEIYANSREFWTSIFGG